MSNGSSRTHRHTWSPEGSAARSIWSPVCKSREPTWGNFPAEEDSERLHAPPE